MAKNNCPCGSGLRYSECCKPLHRGVREASNAVELMRSRYTAFAMKEAPYLWRTLAPNHEDKHRPEDQVLKEIRNAASVNRYMGLQVLDSREPDANGVAQVLFLARVWQGGKNLSFVELSDFVHDGTGWRYWRGVFRPVASLEGDPSKLTIQSFTA